MVFHFRGDFGELVPRTGRKAVVAAVNAVAEQPPQLFVHRPRVFDCQIGNAAPRIEPVGRREGRRGAGVEAGPARAAMVALGGIDRQFQRGEDRPKKEPRSQLAADQIGVLALPAQPRRLSQRFLHHRRGVDEDLNLRRLGPCLAASGIDQPAPEPLELLLHHVVVIAVLCVDRDRRAVLLRQHRSGVVLGAVVLGQHDHRARLGPERRRVAAPMGALGHPAHLPMVPRLEKGRQPLGQLRHVAGAADAAGRKAHLCRLAHQPCLQIVHETPFLWTPDIGTGRGPVNGFRAPARKDAAQDATRPAPELRDRPFLPGRHTPGMTSP